MTYAASQQFFETFPPEVARGILEGDRLRVHAAKVSVVREAGTTFRTALFAGNNRLPQPAPGRHRTGSPG